MWRRCAVVAQVVLALACTAAIYSSYRTDHYGHDHSIITKKLWALGNALGVIAVIIGTHILGVFLREQ